MFETELKTVAQTLTDSLAFAGEFVSFSGLRSAAAEHQWLVRYIEAVAAEQAESLTTTLSTHQYFDFSSDPLNHALRTITTHYADGFRIPVRDLSGLIRQAVHVRCNYLCRPRNTLVWFVFRNERALTVKTALMRLLYFYDYNYLTVRLNDWLTEISKNPEHDHISLVDFERKIEEIDNESVLDLDTHEFLSLIYPICDFFTTSNYVTQDQIPLPPLIIFLDDKKIYPLATSLELYYNESHSRYVTTDRFVTTVNTVVEEVEEMMKADAPEPTEVEPVQSNEAEEVFNTLHALVQQMAENSEAAPLSTISIDLEFSGDSEKSPDHQQE